MCGWITPASVKVLQVVVSKRASQQRDTEAAASGYLILNKAWFLFFLCAIKNYILLYLCIQQSTLTSWNVLYNLNCLWLKIVVVWCQWAFHVLVLSPSLVSNPSWLVGISPVNQAQWAGQSIGAMSSPFGFLLNFVLSVQSVSKPLKTKTWHFLRVWRQQVLTEIKVIIDLPQ